MKLLVQKRLIQTIPVLEVVQEEYRFVQIPVLIYYHGWQTAKELVLTQARKIAKNGFRVLLPDALHHGARKTSVSPIPGFTFWSSIQANLLEYQLLIDFCQKQKLLLHEEIYVGGVSMGGITTCMLMARHPEIKGAACVMGTPEPGIYRDRIFDYAKEHGVFSDELELCYQWIDAFDLSQQPERLAQRPMLFWHGHEDEKIPVSEVIDFQKQLLGKPYAERVQFLFADERHLVKGGVMDQVTDFFVEASN